MMLPVYCLEYYRQYMLQNKGYTGFLDIKENNHWGFRSFTVLPLPSCISCDPQETGTTNANFLTSVTAVIKLVLFVFVSRGHTCLSISYTKLE